MVISIDVFGIKDICPSSFYGSSYETHCSATVVNALKGKAKKTTPGNGERRQIAVACATFSTPVHFISL